MLFRVYLNNTEQNLCPLLATGGIMTTDGEYTVHRFTSNGTFNIGFGTDMVPNVNVSVLVVGGGGGGGMDMGGGGGGGGVVYNASYRLNPYTNTSCKTLLDAGLSTGNGTYTIDPDGPGGNDPFQVYCDMTTEAGRL
jgi:hypothetical protein